MAPTPLAKFEMPLNNAAKPAPIAEVRVELPAEVNHSAVPRLEVGVARSLAEVEAIREIWTAWPTHRDSDIDFCLEFTWAREEVIRPHVIVIYRDGQPKAMLVGRLERTRMTSRIGYLRLPGVPLRALVFSYGGLLGDSSEENCNEFIQSIRTALRQGEASMARLEYLDVVSPLFERARRAYGFATRDHAVKPGPHSVMDLPSDVEELYRGFSQGLRAEVRRKKKKLLAEFGDKVEVRSYRQWDEAERVIPSMEEIAKHTYQRGLGVGFHDTPEMRRRLRFCAQKQWLRIYVLAIDGNPRAFWLGTLSNRVFVSDYNAYDPKFRDYSVGTFLLAAVAEDFCREGVKAIDFGFGEAEYKERFANRTKIEGSVCIFAPKSKGLLLNAISTSSSALDTLTRKVLDRTKLLPRMKKIWRSRLARKASKSEQGATLPQPSENKSK